MRVLITGRQGQLARSLAERAPDDVELILAARPDLDLSRSGTIASVISRAEPDIIINAAAYTAVDKAEDDEALAMLVNGVAPGVVASEARKVGARLIHLSTDYVFDGGQSSAYLENDPTSPLNIYGRSKLAGEEAVTMSGATYAIARICWVYSPFGSNFVKTMLRVAADRQEISVVDDQRGCPSSALDIADALWRVVAVWRRDRDVGLNSIFHIASRSGVSWAQFAEAIFRASRRYGGPHAQVRRIPTSAFPTRAPRPSNSCLDMTKFETMFEHRMPEWAGSLDSVVRRLVSSG